MPTDADLTPEMTLRPGLHEDLTVVADIFIASRLGAVPAMPPMVGPVERAREWIQGWDLARQEVWIAETPAGPVGFANVEDDWLNGLYVVPDAARSGVGSALLDLVKGIRPDGFCLWVFESNTPARDFYHRHGLVDLERTDGSANMERSPDIKMAWPGRDPLAFYRGLIDDVDAGLGDLLARRVALTRVVQEHKRATVGASERDLEREARIAEAMAAHAPELGAERLQRIVHAIITESLDVAGP
jgi:chorismate mutase/ribosomal protein S18 acetylase RimI-like enzyme